MTERENFFRIVNGQQPAWIPCFYDAYHINKDYEEACIPMQQVIGA